MEREDRLLVTDYAENLAMVEKVLQRIDRPRPQVRITALIYDISLQDIEQMGINWNPTLQGRRRCRRRSRERRSAVDSVTHGAVSSRSRRQHAHVHESEPALRHHGGRRCLQSANDARLLADPNVAVLENEEAIFEKVSEIPYQQLTQTQQGGEIGTTAFKKAGITLHVRPKIAADGIIRMDVKPEVSRLTGFTPGDNQPIIDTQLCIDRADRRQSADGRHRRPAATQRRRRIQRHSVPEGLEVGRPAVPLARHRRSRERARRVHHAGNHSVCRRAELPPEKRPKRSTAGWIRFPKPKAARRAAGACRRRVQRSVLRSVVRHHDARRHHARSDADDRRTPRERVDLPAPKMAASSFPPKVKTKRYRFPRMRIPLEPMSAAQIPSAEFQFGVAGRKGEVQAMIADGQLRRLPAVTPAGSSAVIGSVRVAGSSSRRPRETSAGSHAPSFRRPTARSAATSSPLQPLQSVGQLRVARSRDSCGTAGKLNLPRGLLP